MTFVKAFLFLSFFTLTPSMGWSQWAVTKTGNYCRDELQELLQARFGPKAKVINVKNYGSQGMWAMWAQTNLCNGLVYASFLGDGWSCKQSRYGTNHMLVEVRGFEGCKQLIPNYISW